MRKKLTVLLCMLLVFLALPVSARADIGPKPSVVVDFRGLEGETYYATLLSRQKTTGPYSALTDANRSYAHYQPGDEDYGVFLKFAEYEDADGFYFLQYFQNCTETQRFSWTYYPPREFKLLLYFPEEDRFLSSGEHYERYAFDSSFTATVSGQTLAARRSYEYGRELWAMLLRILLTLAIELLIALPFGLWERRRFLLILWVNAATQAALNLALQVTAYLSGWLAFVMLYALLELLVFLGEALLYRRYLPGRGKRPLPVWKPWVYALAANAASFALGLWLAEKLPALF